MLRRSLAVFAALALLGMGGQAAARKASASKPARAPAGAPAAYTVKKGDTLSSIAARHGTTIDAVARLNNIKKRNVVRIGAVLKLPPPAPANTSGLPERLRTSPERLALMRHFDAAAAKHKVPADLLKAVTWMESGWQNDKVSSTGAVGIGQLMPATVVHMRQLMGKRLDPNKPVDNINMSARYLAWLLKQTKGDVRQAVAAYYQGLTSVRTKGALPETVWYVDSVLALRPRF